MKLQRVALAAWARLGCQLKGLGPARGEWTVAGHSWSRWEAVEAEADVPCVPVRGRACDSHWPNLRAGFQLLPGAGCAPFMLASHGPQPRAAGSRPCPTAWGRAKRFHLLPVVIDSRGCPLKPRTLQKFGVWGSTKIPSLDFTGARKTKVRILTLVSLCCEGSEKALFDF